MQDFLRKQTAEHIARTGRSLIGVGGDPWFTYTIGNHLAGKPELLCIGLDPRNATWLLNLVSELPDVAQLAVGGPVPLDIGGEVPLRACPCPEWAKGEYSIQAGQYLRTEAYRLVQVLIPDTAGRFPGEPGCAEPYSRAPVLHLMPAPGERRH